MKFLKSKKAILIIIVLLLAGVGAYFYFINASKLVVTKVKPVSTLVKKTVSASGTVDSDTNADLSFRAIATLDVINVKEGDTVKKGDLLAKANLSSAYSTSQSYKAALDQAIIERDKYINTYASNLSAAGGRETYEFNLQKLVEAVNQAQSSYNAQSALLTNYYIYSPIDATVVLVNKKQGETVTTGETIIKLADINSLFFKTTVDQEDIGLLQLNQKATVTLDAFENIEFNGSVSKIQNFLKSGVDTVEVDINIDKNNKNVLFGMTGDAQIIIQSEQANNALQFDYINSDENNKQFIWVVGDKNKLQKFPISVKLEGDIYTIPNEDISGLTIVVSKNNNVELKENSSVKIEE